MAMLQIGQWGLSAIDYLYLLLTDTYVGASASQSGEYPAKCRSDLGKMAKVTFVFVAWLTMPSE